MHKPYTLNLKPKGIDSENSEAKVATTQTQLCERSVCRDVETSDQGLEF